MPRRAYQRYRERQRSQKEDDRRTIETLNARLATLEVERESLVQRVEVLQKVGWTLHQITALSCSLLSP